MTIMRVGGALARVGGALGRVDASGGGEESRTLLQLSDLTYIGGFNWPHVSSGNSPFDFSMGNFTARREGGTLVFYALGKRADGIEQPLYKFSYPGTGIPAANFPRATILDSYGTVWGSARPVADAEGAWTHGMGFYDDNLYWTYSTVYEGTSHNPALGVTELNPSGAGTHTTTGAWRPNIHSGQFNNSITPVPEWFQSAYGAGPMLQIGSVRCQADVAPFGHSMQFFTPPAPGATTDSVASPGQQSITVQHAVRSSVDVPHARVANYLRCGWVNSELAGPGSVPPSYYCGIGNANATAPTLASQEWAGGSPALMMDWVDTGCWVDTGTKHGILTFGQWVDSIAGYDYPGSDTQAHNWYGPSSCCHGHSGLPMHQATGPGASTVVDMAFIHDPADIAAVLASGADPYAVVPAEIAQITSIPSHPGSAKRDQLYQFGGSYFDPVENLLFLSYRKFNTVEGKIVPACRVYQVS